MSNVKVFKFSHSNYGILKIQISNVSMIHNDSMLLNQREESPHLQTQHCLILSLACMHSVFLAI